MTGKGWQKLPWWTWGLWLLGALILSGCAGQRGWKSPEGIGLEDSECQVSRLQSQLSHFEKELEVPHPERLNNMIRAARLSFLLGELSQQGAKEPYFEKGRRLALLLLQEQPQWAEGHYWLALNLCGLAEAGGPRRGLRMVPEIIEHLEAALKVNPAYDQAGPHRVLGRIYFECPPWPISHGDLHASFRHLSQAVALAPENSSNHLYLAETLLKLGKTAEARKELEQVLKATGHALCPRFLEEDRETARRLLARLEKRTTKRPSCGQGEAQSR